MSTDRTVKEIRDSLHRRQVEGLGLVEEMRVLAEEARTRKEATRKRAG